MIVALILVVLMGLYEGLLFYDPFRNIKFMSRTFFFREKISKLDKIFPIDYGHILKLMISAVLCFGVEALQHDELKPILAHGSILFVVSGILFSLILKLNKKLDERQDIKKPPY